MDRDLGYGDKQLVERIAEAIDQSGWAKAVREDGQNFHVSVGPRDPRYIRVSGYLSMPDSDFYVRLVVDDIQYMPAGERIPSKGDK